MAKRSSGTELEVSTFELLPDDAERDILSEFVTESREILEECEAALLVLEAQPDDQEALNTVFRGFHTTKGTASCLGLVDIGKFAHLAESLLSRMREGEIRCEGEHAETALRSVDALKSMTEGLRTIMEGGNAGPPEGLDSLLRDLTGADGASTPSGKPATPAPPGESVKQEPPPSTDSGQESLRVRTDRLDRLIDMVGELVVAESMVVRHCGGLATTRPELSKQIDRTVKIVREIQDLSLSMRMIPMRGVFQKLTRIVRDLSHKCDVAVDFVTEGEDTEIDRTMVEWIADPLVHMVRNAIDHGLESTDERIAAGKPATGRVRLSALHAGGNIVIVLEDDGRGLHRDAIAAKAVRNGLIRSAAGMSDSEVFNLLLEAGFSTADEITDLSGRGVGLDVVRRSIDRLQGRLDIQSTAGQGTTFTMRLPLTLAITDGMQIRVGAQRYILPTINIAMSFRPRSAEVATVAGRGELIRRRDECLPLYRLAGLFTVPEAAERIEDGLIVIVDDGERRYGLLVDELVGQQQVVVKPLESGYGKIPGVSAAAILGDGKVGLILEPRELGILGDRDPARIPPTLTDSGIVDAAISHCASGPEGSTT